MKLGKCNRDELYVLLAIFDRLDSDGSGAIDKADIEAQKASQSKLTRGMNASDLFESRASDSDMGSTLDSTIDDGLGTQRTTLASGLGSASS
jgi:hypothetical protein